MKVKRRLDLLERRARPALVGAGVLLIFALGFLNYVAGPGISFALFYLIPVSSISWYAGRYAGALASVLSAVAWLAAAVLTRPGAGWLDPLLYSNAITTAGFYLVVVHLLAELRGALDRERQLARTDDLTGIANARAFAEMAARETERARRYGHPLTLVYLDVDNFKEVNDRFGHSEGDEVLRAVATALKTHLRSTDVVGRLHGDEFAVLLPEADREAARAVTTKLRSVLMAEAQRRGWPISFSIGIVTCAEPPDDFDALLREADRLMYEVKSSGKDDIRQGLLPLGSQVARNPG